MLAGAFIAVQAPINRQLARGLGLPVAAAAFSFLSGAIVLGHRLAGVVTHAGHRARLEGAGALAVRRRRRARRLPMSPLSTILTPRIGAAALMAFLVAGQLLAGMLLDRVGFLGMAVREISLGRVAGASCCWPGRCSIRLPPDARRPLRFRPAGRADRARARPSRAMRRGCWSCGPAAALEDRHRARPAVAARSRRPAGLQRHQGHPGAARRHPPARRRRRRRSTRRCTCAIAPDRWLAFVRPAQARRRRRPHQFRP